MSETELTIELLSKLISCVDRLTWFVIGLGLIEIFLAITMLKTKIELSKLNKNLKEGLMQTIQELKDGLSTIMDKIKAVATIALNIGTKNLKGGSIDIHSGNFNAKVEIGKDLFSITREEAPNTEKPLELAKSTESEEEK
jgi:hypothetical protein